MSDYRVVWPDEAVDHDFFSETEEAPVILQFRVSPAAAGAERMDIITRARLLFENRCCPSCSYPVVTPIELNDAQFNRNRLPIPGTATLVGFRCAGCKTEWSV
jgi:hypothetical protein